jgi:hypothetical protein
MEPAASVLWRDILHRASGTILKCQAIEFIESDFNTTIKARLVGGKCIACHANVGGSWRFDDFHGPDMARPCHEAIDQRLSHDGIEIVRFKVTGQLKGLAQLAQLQVSDGPRRSYRETHPKASWILGYLSKRGEQDF